MAHNDLGIALMGSGRPAEAALHYRKAIGLDPELPQRPRQPRPHS